MIDIGKILKRAWHILWNYKILWIFGVLLAITAGGNGGNNGGGSGNTGFQFNSSDIPNQSTIPWVQDLNTWFQQNLFPLVTRPLEHISTLIWIGVGLLLFILVTSVITWGLRYVSETAAIRMVDEYERSGTKAGFKQGWKMGWSRPAFRMWVIDLILGLPALVFFLLLVGLGIGAYFSFRNGSQALATGSIVVAIIVAILAAFLLVLVMVFLDLLRQFFIRKAALEGTGIGASFRQGWQMFKSNWKNAGLMWLVMLGMGIGFAIASFIAFFLLIPVFIITGVAGLVVAVIPALVGYGITSLFASGPLAWIVAILVGLPFFGLVLGSPLLLLSGWAKIFSSATWTLTYRELKTMETLAANPPQAFPPMSETK